MIAEAFANLLQGLVSGSIALALVMLVRGSWRQHLGAAALPWLWLAVPVACIAVWLPARSVSIILPELGVLPATTFAQPSPQADAAATWAWPQWIALCWALGGGVALGWFGWQQWRFHRSLGRLAAWQPGIRRASSAAAGPAVVSLLRPTIVIPADFEARYSPQQQLLILEHERSHVQRGDIYILAVATLLRAVYWFNPWIHRAERMLRHDLELASDAAVIRRYPHSRKLYAETLLNVQLAVPGLPVGCLWQSSHPLKERIMMLRQSPPAPATRRLALALGAALAVGLGSLAWAGQPGSAPSQVAEQPSHRVKLAIEYAGERSTPELHFAVGVPFAVAIGEGAQRMTIDMRVEPRPPGHELLSEVRQHGKLLASNRYGFNGRMNYTQLASGDAGALTLEGVVEPLNASSAQAANTPADRGPVPVHAPAPGYPQAAKDAGVEGRVVVRADIDAQGRVREAIVVSADPSGVFDETVRASVLGWQFQPASKHGKPVAASVEIPVCFALDGDAPCAGTSAAGKPDGAS